MIEVHHRQFSVLLLLCAGAFAVELLIESGGSRVQVLRAQCVVGCGSGEHATAIVVKQTQTAKHSAKNRGKRSLLRTHEKSALHGLFLRVLT
jgi:hypothetical protein